MRISSSCNDASPDTLRVHASRLCPYVRRNLVHLEFLCSRVDPTSGHKRLSEPQSFQGGAASSERRAAAAQSLDDACRASTRRGSGDSCGISKIWAGFLEVPVPDAYLASAGAGLLRRLFPCPDFSEHFWQTRASFDAMLQILL